MSFHWYSTRAAWAAWLATALAATGVLVADLQGGPASATSSLVRTTATRPTSSPAPAGPTATPAVPAARGPVVVLGDSVAAGSACGCTSYATLLARGLANRTGTVVSLSNEGADGLTSSGLLDQLRRPEVRQALSRAGVVTVTIGANDFDPGAAGEPACAGAGCYTGALQALSSHLEAALREVHQLVPDQARVLVTGYWNVFLDGAVGRTEGADYVANSDALTRRVNQVIQSAAVAAHDRYVDEYGPFESGSLPRLTALLAPDGDHPSAAGHALIAQLLLAAL